MVIIIDLMKLIILVVGLIVCFYFIKKDLNSFSGKYSTSSLIGALSFALAILLGVLLLMVTEQLIYDLYCLGILQ